MARIILTIPGPWSKPPELAETFELRFLDADREAVEDIVLLARKSDALTPDQVGALRKHQSIVEAELVFQRPGDRAAASAAAKLCVEAFAAGALVAFVETSLKVFAPEAFKGAELDDTNTLFHLFVEVMMDENEVVTEGLQCFDLPDVVVAHDATDPESGEAAQAAAFSLAAQMVCDRLRPTSGGVFRASESAPWYRLALRTPAPELTADDAFVNPRGVWVLTPRKA